MPTNDVLIKSGQKELLTRTSKLTLQEQIAEIITVKIEEGEYSPGDKLPSVRELADIFKVSRETAKLALGALKKQGYIEIIPSRGGYVRDVSSRGSQSTKTGSLGFIIDLGDGPQPQSVLENIFESILQHIDAQVVKWDNHIITSYIVYGDPSDRARFSGLIDKIDGLFVTGLINSDLLTHLQQLPVPVVSILPNLEVDLIDDIGIDSEKTYYRTTKRMLERGHRKLVYLDGPKTYYRELRRIDGCSRAMGEYLEDGAGLVEYHAGGWSPEAAYEETKKMLEKEADIDLIIAVNDFLAKGVMRACHEKGRAIPKDVSIIGAKNTILSTSATPPLSSIDYHFEELARIAAQRMKERIYNPELVPVRTEILGTLIERGTTISPKKEVV